MRLVFVHGMRQEGQLPAALLQVWEEALRGAWSRNGLSNAECEIEMPFYGDELNRLTEEVRGGDFAIVRRGAGDAGTFTPLEEALIRDMAAKEGITDADVRQEVGEEVVARGPANWEWLQAMARVLERRVFGLGALGLGFVRQVDGYLTRPHIRSAVDDIVRPALLRGPAVVVAHSLGTVVSFRLLRAAGAQARVPLFVTLGSPLAINAVKRHLRPPVLAKPAGVGKWLNGTDERDYVALYSRLDRDTFAEGIENLSDIHNRQDDAHAIADYLADRFVAERIHAALT
jgi:pimeloyl-ACP methyl ester carboxylesterase